MCTIPCTYLDMRALTPVACALVQKCSRVVVIPTLRPKRLNYSTTTCMLWRYILGPRFPADVAKQLKFDFDPTLKGKSQNYRIKMSVTKFSTHDTPKK